MGHGEDLYEMLGVDKTASQADIKKAYLRGALQWHPDRNPAPEATAKFQALQRIYEVLSDPAKRALYDRTGSLQECEDMVAGDNFQELYAAFREAMRVTEDDLDAFAATYRGSDEERADLLRLYSEFGGNMTRVLDWLMLSRADLDSHRFRDTLQAAIQAGELTATKAYKAWAAKVAATPPPKQDPLAPPPKRAAGSEQALVAAIQGKRQSTFNGMLASLEAKYGGGGSGGGKAKGKASSSKRSAPAAAAAGSSKRPRKAAAAAAAGSDEDEDSSADENAGPEPTDAEFEAARQRLLQRQGPESGGGGSSKAAAGKQKGVASSKAKAKAGGSKQKQKKRA